jgi:hypothetical protein
MADILVQCTRCRNKHMESERVSKRRKGESMSDLCCPRCGGMTFFDLRPQVAWCWASGLIEIGDKTPTEGHDGSGAIEIAHGPRSTLISVLEAAARHGKGASAGKLLVPGVPEANTQKEKGDALAAWLGWCGKRKNLGVVFSTEIRS